MNDSRSRLQFTAAAFLFGTNGLLAAYIPLTGAQTVLLRTVLGSLFLAAAAASWLPILWLGLVNTGLAYYLYFSSLQKLPGQTASLLCYLDPLTSLVLSAAFLHERLLPMQLLGAALILGGAVLGEVGPPRRARR